MNPLITITSFWIFIFIKAFIDKELFIDKGKSPNHMVEIVMVIGATIVHAGLIAQVHTPKNWVPDDYTMSVLLFYPMAWWTFFDGILSKLRGLKFFYIGHTAWSDRLFQRLGKPSYIISKVVAMALMIVSIYIMYAEYE